LILKKKVFIEHLQIFDFEKKGFFMQKLHKAAFWCNQWPGLWGANLVQAQSPTSRGPA